MNEIRLVSLTMTNFRGEKYRKTEFNAEGDTSIYGANKSGKSRHFDAFLWVLFGKDKEDRKDFEVRTIVNREPLHRVECSVEAELLVNQKHLTIKRELAERWVKPHGAVQEELKGNETICYWNGVPINVRDYESRIKSLLENELFKVLSNPLYFTSLDWKRQREILMKMTASVSDREIANQKAEFRVLYDTLNGKPMEIYERELSIKKKTLKDKKDEIAPRIDQTYRLMPKEVDIDSVNKRKEEIQLEIKNIDKAISDDNELYTQQSDVLKSLHLKRTQLIIAKQEALDMAIKNEKDRVNKLNADRVKLQEEIKEIERKMWITSKDLESISVTITQAQQTNLSREVELAKLREDWATESKRQFDDNILCTMCEQRLPEDKIAEAALFFDKAKRENIDKITQLAAKLKEVIDIQNSKIQVLANELEQKSNLYDELSKELSIKTDILNNTPVVRAENYNASNVEECLLIDKQIEEVSKEIEKNKIERTDNKELINKRNEFIRENTELDLKLADVSIIERYKIEIEKLQDELQFLSQDISDIEKIEYDIMQFMFAKIEENEARINKLFSKVTFKLFDYTYSGKKEECCIPYVDGVPYSVSNTASQLNGGLDIINTLTEFYGISVPIFIDNAEGANSILETKGQKIKLIVTEDKELIVK